MDGLTGLAGLIIDAGELERLSRRLQRVGPRLQQRIVRRSMATVMRRLRTETIRRIVAGTEARPSVVRNKVRAMHGSGNAQVTVKSPWIPLIDLGAARAYGPRRLRDEAGRFSGGQNRGGGVTVRGWGRHKGAFIATMASGHRGIFVRKGAGRHPIKELWGPNPAQHVVKHEGEYLAMLAALVQSELVPELDRLFDIALRGL